MSEQNFSDYLSDSSFSSGKKTKEAAIMPSESDCQVHCINM